MLKKPKTKSLSEQQREIVEFLSRPGNKGQEFSYGDIAEFALKKSRATHSQGVGSSMKSLGILGYADLCKMVVKKLANRKKKS